jgi:penicillin-binding protein 2
VIRELGHDPGQPGEDIWLTIDQEVQNFAAQRLGQESAACVVTDVASGDVLAFVSTPGFDPNDFNVGITPDRWRALTGDDHKPLLDKAIGGTYPPGSTFKPTVALAAVDAGIATPDYRVLCTGALVFGGHTFHCWKKGGHGLQDLKDGIKNSCDVFFYETARRVGIDRIQAAALKMGFGAPTGIELPGEKSGLVPSREWKEKTYHQAWQQGDTLSVGIGQGYLTVTPLQLAQEVTRIASGRALSPRLVHMVGGRAQSRDPAPAIDFAGDAFARVREGMIAVTNEPGGSAYAWRITEPGFEMAGKTGTAQVRVYSQAEHLHGMIKNENLEWKLRDHALFTGFAPISNPKYAIVCLIEHGATVAHQQVQMARDILLFTQKRDPLGRPVAYPLKAAASGASVGGG